MDRKAGGVCQGVAVSAGSDTRHRGLLRTSDHWASDGCESGEE